jgi:hypothetical protein
MSVILQKNQILKRSRVIKPDDAKKTQDTFPQNGDNILETAYIQTLIHTHWPLLNTSVFRTCSYVD